VLFLGEGVLHAAVRLVVDYPSFLAVDRRYHDAGLMTMKQCYTHLNHLATRIVVQADSPASKAFITQFHLSGVVNAVEVQFH
jgi:hypothetical protein